MRSVLDLHVFCAIPRTFNREICVGQCLYNFYLLWKTQSPEKNGRNMYVEKCSRGFVGHCVRAIRTEYCTDDETITSSGHAIVAYTSTFFGKLYSGMNLFKLRLCVSYNLLKLYLFSHRELIWYDTFVFCLIVCKMIFLFC